MKFSIVVATYNRKEILKKCLECVLLQTYKDFELLVVDDGSTDCTDETMSHYSDERIRYIKLDKNYGTATPARNRGIEEMTGDALIIWDSDDFLLPNALEVLQSGFDEHEEVGIVCTSTDFCKDGVKQEYPRSESTYLSVTDWFGGKKSKDSEIIAIRKDLIGDVRFESRSIDFMFYAKIVGGVKPKIYYVNETCGVINLESDSLSLTHARKKKNNVLSIERAPILDSYLEKYGELYFIANAHGKYAGFAFGSAIGYLRDGDYRNSKKMFVKANKAHFTLTWKVMELLVSIPLLNIIFHKFAKR